VVLSDGLSLSVSSIAPVESRLKNWSAVKPRWYGSELLGLIVEVLVLLLVESNRN
jgi:hypothetical protein